MEDLDIKRTLKDSAICTDCAECLFKLGKAHGLAILNGWALVPLLAILFFMEVAYFIMFFPLLCPYRTSRLLLILLAQLRQL